MTEKKMMDVSISILIIAVAVGIFYIILWGFGNPTVTGEVIVEEVVVTVPTEQEDLRSYAREQAELLEVDPDKFIRLITCESQWDPKAKNPVS